MAAPTTIDLSWLLHRPPVPDAKTFEIALVMGGTVSAGAYTAGAVDFLIQALDCWETALAHGDPSAPTHNVVLKVITGTSGGGVIAATLARALAYDFPHISKVTMQTDPAAAGNNPLFQLWIKRLRLAGLLGTADLDAGRFGSLLDPTPIDNAAKYIAAFTMPAPVAPEFKPRRFVASPLRVIVTLTNLTGIPFQTDFGGGLTQTYVDHADFAKFAVGMPKANPADPGQPVEWPVMPFPDEFGLTAIGQAVPHAIAWDDFATFGVATGAFPIGFPARALARPVDQYQYRVVNVPMSDPSIVQYQPLTPDWNMVGMQPGTGATYRFWAVDGGATDNEPIELARTALSGYYFRSPRDAASANRAVLLIDPFAGEADMGPAVTPPAPGAPPPSLDLLSAAAGALNGLTQQTRYDTADLLLAADPDVYSRFMITARRPNGDLGGKALASAGLDAFMGFACEAFSLHDYYLGRKNCQDFLQTEFVLDKSNPIMAAGWSAGQIAAHHLLSAPQLPIIPLMGDARVPEALDDWPVGALDPETYKPAIEARLNAIGAHEGGNNPINKLLTWIGTHIAGGPVADYVIGKMNEALVAANLQAPPPPPPPEPEIGGNA